MYPKKVKLFVPWSKAMVAGATVGSPDYSTTGKRHRKNRARRVSRRRRRKNRAQD